MRYQQKRFSVMMPGEKVEWPFERNKKLPAELEFCGACGAADIFATTRPHIHGDDCDRPRKRICFGK